MHNTENYTEIIVATETHMPLSAKLSKEYEFQDV